MNERLSFWWWSRQGLDGRLRGRTCQEAIQRAGWIRSVGGSTPYLSLWARTGATREVAETAAASVAIQELPSARGCTYFVAEGDYPIALRLSQGVKTADTSAAERLGVPPDEIERLCEAVYGCLQGRALEPREIRSELGGRVRDLGAEGRRRGVASTLPVALSHLQRAGKIRRISTDGRLDHERYRYTAWDPSPLEGVDLDATEARRGIAERYFRWIGPATIAEFRWFTGFGVGMAAEAVAGLDLVDIGEGRLAFRDDAKAICECEAPTVEQVALLSSLDALFLLRRQPLTLIAEEDLHGAFSGAFALKPSGALHDLPSHGIVDRGRLIGLWEFDPDEGRIAWATFNRPTPVLEQAIAEAQDFVRTIGDARAFSLDSPKSRRPRIEALDRARLSRPS